MSYLYAILLLLCGVVIAPGEDAVFHEASLDKCHSSILRECVVDCPLGKQIISRIDETTQFVSLLRSNYNDARVHVAQLPLLFIHPDVAAESIQMCYLVSEAGAETQQCYVDNGDCLWAINYRSYGRFNATSLYTQLLNPLLDGLSADGDVSGLIPSIDAGELVVDYHSIDIPTRGAEIAALPVYLDTTDGVCLRSLVLIRSKPPKTAEREGRVWIRKYSKGWYVVGWKDVLRESRSASPHPSAGIDISGFLSLVAIDDETLGDTTGASSSNVGATSAAGSTDDDEVEVVVESDAESAADNTIRGMIAGLIDDCVNEILDKKI